MQHDLDACDTTVCRLWRSFWKSAFYKCLFLEWSLCLETCEHDIGNLLKLLCYIAWLAQKFTCLLSCPWLSKLCAHLHACVPSMSCGDHAPGMGLVQHVNLHASIDSYANWLLWYIACCVLTASNTLGAHHDQCAYSTGICVMTWWCWPMLDQPSMWQIIS